jgi:Transketolase, thiamine diphosphate binding domain
MDLFCGSSAAGPKLTHLGREVNIGLSYFQEAMKISDTTVPRNERRNFAVMRVDSARPDWPDRDRFVVGKGHAAPTLYSALIRGGFIPELWIHDFEVPPVQASVGRFAERHVAPRR